MRTTAIVRVLDPDVRRDMSPMEERSSRRRGREIRPEVSDWAFESILRKGGIRADGKLLALLVQCMGENEWAVVALETEGDVASLTFSGRVDVERRESREMRVRGHHPMMTVNPDGRISVSGDALASSASFSNSFASLFARSADLLFLEQSFPMKTFDVGDGKTRRSYLPAIAGGVGLGLTALALLMGKVLP